MNPSNGRSYIKVNVDDSFVRGSSCGGIGFVLRDSKGNVLLQFDREVCVDLVVHAELLAIREGIFGGGCIATLWIESLIP